MGSQLSQWKSHVDLHGTWHTSHGVPLDFLWDVPWMPVVRCLGRSPVEVSMGSYGSCHEIFHGSFHAIGLDPPPSILPYLFCPLLFALVFSLLPSWPASNTFNMTTSSALSKHQQGSLATTNPRLWYHHVKMVYAANTGTLCVDNLRVTFTSQSRQGLFSWPE